MIINILLINKFTRNALFDIAVVTLLFGNIESIMEPTEEQMRNMKQNSEINN